MIKNTGHIQDPCECGKVRIGQSGRSVHLRIKEHNKHVRLAQHNKSAVAKYVINHEYIIKLPDNRLIREAIELQMQPQTSTEKIA